jgi:hypothetical protein
MTWKHATTVELDPTDSDCDGDIRRERFIWREYSICGIFPMQIPDYISDDVIGDKLRQCEREQRLPWAINDAELTWRNCHECSGPRTV